MSDIEATVGNFLNFFSYNVVLSRDSNLTDGEGMRYVLPYMCGSEYTTNYFMVSFIELLEKLSCYAL